MLSIGFDNSASYQPLLFFFRFRYLANFTLGLPTHPTGHWEYTNGGIFLTDIGQFLKKGLMTVSVYKYQSSSGI